MAAKKKVRLFLRDSKGRFAKVDGRKNRVLTIRQGSEVLRAEGRFSKAKLIRLQKQSASKILAKRPKTILGSSVRITKELPKFTKASLALSAPFSIKSDAKRFRRQQVTKVFRDFEQYRGVVLSGNEKFGEKFNELRFEIESKILFRSRRGNLSRSFTLLRSTSFLLLPFAQTSLDSEIDSLWSDYQNTLETIASYPRNSEIIQEKVRIIFRETL